MLLLQATETLSKYDQIPIVIGMIICMAIIVFAIKYLTPKKIELSGVEAIEITTEMLNKVKNVTIDGSTLEKRGSKLQHDTAQALANHTDMSGLIAEVIETNNKVVESQEKVIISVNNLNTTVHTLNENMVGHYKSTDQKTDELNKTLLNLLVKNKR